LLKKGDTVQAARGSKVVEEAVKILVKIHNLDAYRKSVEVGGGAFSGLRKQLNSS